jgi:hypothetical protein
MQKDSNIYQERKEEKTRKGSSRKVTRLGSKEKQEISSKNKNLWR